MGLDEALDKSGQSGAGVEVHSDSGDERLQDVKVYEKPMTAQEIKQAYADKPENGGEEDHGR